MKTFSESAFIKSILKSIDDKPIIQIINFVAFSHLYAFKKFFQLFSKRLHRFSDILPAAFRHQIKLLLLIPIISSRKIKNAIEGEERENSECAKFGKSIEV